MIIMNRVPARALGRALSAAVAMALPATAALSAQTVADAEAAYARVAKSWSTTRTLQANFDQKISNPILGRTVASRGVFVQERPNRVSITFTDPAVAHYAIADRIGERDRNPIRPLLHEHTT